MWIAVSIWSSDRHDTCVRYHVQTLDHPQKGSDPFLRHTGSVMAFLAPDVLVLAAGGVLGEAWMSGVLRRDRGRRPARTSGRRESFVGTSAGSIVCARLAAGRSPRRPQGVGRPESDGASARRRGRRRRPPARPAALGDAGGDALGAGRRPRRSCPAALALGARGGAMAPRARCCRGVPDRRADAGRPPRDGRALGRALRRAPARLLRRPRVGPARRLRRARRPPTPTGRRRGRRVVLDPVGLPARSTIGGREYVDGGVWSAHQPRRRARRARHATCCA